jgi:hypothetical protein
MPSPAPVLSPSVVVAPATPNAVFTLAPGMVFPKLGPTYPKAGPLGLLAVALAYFAIGVAVGALVKQRPHGRRWLPLLVVPGVLAGLAYLVWVVRTLR